MIEVTNLSRRYGSLLAVDGVSFGIGRGEIVGLLGHNGAGKSTIMKMLTGFLEPDSGEIRIGGKDILARRGRAQAQIGYLPENCPLYPEMSVVDFLDFSGAMRGLEEGERAAAIRRAVAQTELESKALAPIATLSRGFRQRVGVAQALLHQPPVLILDEPTNGLDPGQIEQMRRLIRDLGKQATVVLSTHILQEVEATCDRVLILRQGKLAVDARLADLRRAGFLRLRCDASPEQVLAVFSEVPEVAETFLVEGRDGVYTYRLRPRLEPDSVTAAVARAVVQAGWQLHALHPEEQSLERVFHAATAGEVNAHAA